MARRAFMTETGEKVRRIGEGEDDAGAGDAEGITATKSDKGLMPPPPVPSFKRVVKKKKDLGAALGIKKKPALVWNFEATEHKVGKARRIGNVIS
ncbi:MAG: hypothetical protein LQ337_007392 [Flavoplaca oasis]|nr:MAG: hypothetical protein LQ337_007392 [Flavoplaca oasis]